MEDSLKIEPDMRVSVSPDYLNELKNVFKQFCTDPDRGLTRQDLKIVVLALFGYKPKKSETIHIINSYSQSKEDVSPCDKTLNFQEYVLAMAAKRKTLGEDDEIRQTFLAFDSTCRGYLTRSDLYNAFSQVAPRISKAVIDSAFREVDRDGDGRVSFKDFEFMMKYSKE